MPFIYIWTLQHVVSENETVTWNTMRLDACPLDQTVVAESDINEWTCARGHKWIRLEYTPC